MRQHILVGFVALLMVLGGCRRDLGECNASDPSRGVAATAIAYQITDGLPMYEGQAIIQQSCGNGQFCHSPNAVGSKRIGAPFGLDFDVALACTDSVEACATTDCTTDPDSAICESYKRLQSNVASAFDLGGLAMGQIRSGAMPPGESGRRVQGQDSFMQTNNTPSRTDDDKPLPGIDTPEGREIVRNWLACSAPVISRTDESSQATELRRCPSVDQEECVFRGPSLVPDPTWSSIYKQLIFRQCVGCHGPPNGNRDVNADNPLANRSIPGGASPEALKMLDLTGADLTDTSGWAAEVYDVLVNVAASDQGDCAGAGTLIVAEDAAASIMVQKLRGEQMCGEVMPPNEQQIPTIAPAVVSVVEAWIANKAPND